MGPPPDYIMSKKPRLVRVKLLFLLIAEIIQLQNFSLLNHIDTKIHRGYIITALAYVYALKLMILLIEQKPVIKKQVVQ